MVASILEMVFCTWSDSKMEGMSEFGLFYIFLSVSFD